MENKRGFDFSFGWIFAIIVGGIIIFLAIYATTRFVDLERTQIDTEAGKEIGIILSPIETSLEDSRGTILEMPRESRIFNDCDSYGNFGSQQISVSTKSGIGEEWQRPGFKSTFYNKYLFSSQTMEGKRFVVFVKSFEMPFKVADVMTLFPEDKMYCFINPSREVEEDLSDLNETFPGLNVNFVDNIEDCDTLSEKVCFEAVDRDCDTIVNTQAKSVKKYGQTMYYTDSLIYGAVFSDPGVYECQVKRLMKRISELSLLYYDKTNFLTPRGCSSNMGDDLITYSSESADVNSSAELKQLEVLSKYIGDKNERISECKLF